jgi:shikimate kinase
MRMQTPSTHYRTISLIGMPGAGKSTVGVLLAKLVGLQYTDTDLSIQQREQASLQDVLEREGHVNYRRIEEEVVLAEPLDERVVATGGSVIYSDTAMQRLLAAGPVVYLRVDVETLKQRIAINPLRGIASDGAQSYEDIYAERTPIYERYATHSVDAVGGNADAIAALIVQALHI